MTWIALRMLTGDRSKYIAIIFGVTFACFLIAEQTAIFCGVMLRTTGQIYDTQGADIWVMNPNLRYLDDAKAISDNDVFRVRSVPGVLWAVNFYRGQGQAQLANGNYQGVILMGLDDSSLVGAPTHVLVGDLGDLQNPDAILVDEAGFHQMWPGEPLHTGKVIEMNDRRAVIVGVYRGSQTFMTMPIVYTRFSQATLFVPPSRRLMPYVLAKCEPGASPVEVARRIEAQTGLKAQTKGEFTWLTMKYYLQHTGIPVNFGTTVILAFLVGCAIAGPDVLPVHRGEPQAVRHAESDGHERRPGGGHDSHSGAGRGGNQLRPRRRPGNAVRHRLPARDAAVGLFLAVAGAGGHGRRGAGHRAVEQFAEHSPCPGVGTGRRLQVGGTMNGLATPTPGVICRNLVKDYISGSTRVQALRGINLNILPGELTLVVGPSGCGKTTLISILAATLDATSGDVSVLGVDLPRLSKHGKADFRAKNVGFVFQQFNLLPSLTAAENVAVPLVINGMGHVAAVTKARESLEKSRSGGSGRRAAGAAIRRPATARRHCPRLVHKPRLLVCDEPTSAIDAQTGRVVMELIREVALQPDRVVVVVTHDARVFSFGDRIITLEDGRVAQEKQVPNPLANGVLVH